MSNTLSLPQIEETILKFWKKEKIFEKSLLKTQSKPIYAFYDGPPFATGLPHHGHLLASTIKDIIPRYFTMRGYFVARRFGWDCHGLPIEYEIDKKLGLSTQAVIQQKGVAGYNQECRAIVQRYVTQWQATIERMGRWVDFDNAYKTMDPEFMESVWWVFKQLWEKNLIYHGTKVVPYSTALNTVLSNFEASSNYQNVQDPAITVLLKLVDEPTYLAVWTTTPWTLPSNLGVCINADFEYVKVRDEIKQLDFIIAAARLEAISKGQSLTVLESFKGATLVNKAYQPLFPYFKQLSQEGAFRVYSDDFVTLEEGTGLVQMAPAFGEDDHRVMRQAGIKTIVCPLDESGKFSAEVSDFVGLYVKDADPIIIKRLKEMGQLYHHATLVHSYPYCPRSDTPLIYRAIDSWFVRVESIKDRLLKANKEVHWVPAHIQQGRFGKWLEGARDWAISRNRVWGTPLPIWVNDTTQKTLCIGSIQELKDLSNKPITDLHREQVDPITFSLPGEPGVYRRVPEVLDCWFESGSMPYAQLHYPFENKQQFNQGYPADFIAEGRDQTRGWFYTLMVLSVALFNKPAFKNVIVTGMVMAEDGKKMSKRLRNYTPPDKLMTEYGADALRLYLINSGLVRAEEQRFSDEGVKDMARRTLLPWYNAFNFLETYATVDGWDPQQHQQSSDNIVDQWIYSRIQSLKATIERHMQTYQLYYVVPELLHFIDDLTNCYIRFNRQRFWAPSLSADKCAAYSTLFNIIHEFTLCMAPFTPFLAEHIYQALGSLAKTKGKEPFAQSVHLRDYPQPAPKYLNHELERAVQRLQQIILMGRQKRNEHRIKVKIPLQKLVIIHKDPRLLKEISKLEHYLKQELNVKTIAYDTEEAAYITLYAKPCSPRLGKRFGKRFPHFKRLIEALNPESITALEKQGQVQLEQEVLSLDDILIFREPKAGTDTLSNRFISIKLDTKLDPDQIEAGLAREVVNRIQKSRKRLDLKVNDRILIDYATQAKLAQIIQRYDSYICQETLALALKPTEFKEKQLLTFSIDKYQIEFNIQVKPK